MGGTLLNTVTVALGSVLGLFIGDHLPERVRESVMIGIGLITIVVGLDNAAATNNLLVPLLSVVIGVAIGELLRLDAQLERLAGWLQLRFGGQTQDDAPQEGLSPRERFITGFVTASLVFCVGPLTILGSIQDGMGLQAGFDNLAIKSTLDGFAAMAFAATFGIGVLFTTLTIFLFQGGLALLGFLAGEFMSAAMIAEMTAAGGVILIGLALVILEIKPVRVANFLPALVVAPLLVLVAQGLGIY